MDNVIAIHTKERIKVIEITNCMECPFVHNQGWGVWCKRTLQIIHETEHAIHPLCPLSDKEL